MYLPMVNGGGKNRRYLLEFGGIDLTEGAAEGKLSDSRGLCADYYPSLGPREGRRPEAKLQQGSAVFGWGKLCWVDGSDLFYDGKVVGQVTPGEKQFAAVNTKLCIFPDKKYIDIREGKLKYLEGNVANREGADAVFGENTLTLARDVVIGETEGSFISFRPIMNRDENRTDTGEISYFKVYDELTWDPSGESWMGSGERELGVSSAGMSDLAGRCVIPMEDADGHFALNTRKEKETRTATGTDIITTREELSPYGPDSQKGVYGIITKVTVTDESSHFYNEYYAWRVELTIALHDANQENMGFEGVFEPGHRVWVSGCSIEANNTPEDKPLVVEAVEGRTITFTITDQGQKLTAGTVQDAVMVKSKVPDLDYICEKDNRLWGVCTEDKTIYASALGDPKNFGIYRGVDTDSYAVAVGSDGPWTGIVSYGDGVLCWKEDCLHKIMGDGPSSYAMYTYRISGVQPGSAKSMAVVDEVLYYKGENGVYAYTGDRPQLISASLGRERFRDAVGGTDGRRYYLSMEDGSGHWAVWAYDLLRGIWLKEDDRRALDFANLGGVLYRLDEDGTVWKLGQTDGDGGTVEWLAQLAPINETDHGRKIYSRFVIRLRMEAGSWAKLEARYDGGIWTSLWVSGPAVRQTAVIPVRPARCDRVELRISGKGRCVVESVERVFSVGGLK